MSKASLIVFAIFVALVVGGGIFLAAWDIPAPLTRIEKVVPNDRFPK